MSFIQFLFDHPGQDEIARAADDLVERFGADAGLEATHMAEVYRQLGSWRNLRLYRRVADELARKSFDSAAPDGSGHE